MVTSVYSQSISDSGQQIITKSQCHLQNGQHIFISVALWQVKFGEILKSVWLLLICLLHTLIGYGIRLEQKVK